MHRLHLRLIDAPDVEWQDRAHFYGVASHVMRRILVDAARLAAQPSAVARPSA